MQGQVAAIDTAARASLAKSPEQIAALERAVRRIAPPGRRVLPPAQRAAVAPLQAQLSAAIAGQQQARAAASAATSVLNLIAERRREGFSARLFERSASPLTPDFWTAIVRDAGSDAQRLDVLSDDAVEKAREAPEPQGFVGLALGVVLAGLSVGPLRWALERLARRRIGSAARPGLARTASALWVAAADTGLPTLGAGALRLGAQWGRLLSEEASALASAAVVATAWAAAILALGRVLATDRDPRQRLLDLPDGIASRLRAPLAALALVTSGGFLLTRLNYVIGASVAATVAANCVVSLAYAGVACFVLLRFGSSRASLRRDDGSGSGGAPIWTAISLALSLAVLVIFVALLGGYTTLAAVVAGQIFWLGLIAAVTYLLVQLAGELCATLFDQRGWAARSLLLLFGLRRSTIRQAGVLVSAALQLVIMLVALGLALTPFGQSGDRLLAALGRFGAAIRIGPATISPPAIAAGLIVLFIGIALAHALQAWVRRRYLPVTDWDSGVRDSVTTGVGYLGVAVAVIIACSAMGLNFAQVALIASALSVGIGFGLQQVVQNFISGVIVLVERPVRVGDWVNIDGVEGDVRRIRVRATEIQTFDRSTVIVPNSDLITKSVQNRSIGEPRGRIELTLSIANAAEAEKVRELLLSAAAADARVLADPPPAVFIDSIAAGGVVNFICHAYVATPRDVRKVKSELYFAVLEAFRQNKIAFSNA